MDTNTNFTYGLIIGIVDIIEDSKLKIISNDAEWLDVAYCFKLFGEAGRSLFHRVSCVYPKYHPQKANNMYTAVLGSSIQPLSLLYLIDLTKIKHPKNCIKNIKTRIIKEEVHLLFQSINYN